MGYVNKLFLSLANPAQFGQTTKMVRPYLNGGMIGNDGAGGSIQPALSTWGHAPCNLP